VLLLCVLALFAVRIHSRYVQRVDFLIKLQHTINTSNHHRSIRVHPTIQLTTLLPRA
jgi:hypothetical protein